MEKEFSTEIKRFYMPFQQTVKCCKCNHDIEIDLEYDHLDYPIANKDFKHYLYCEECDTEQYITAKLKIEFEVKGETFE